MGNRGVVRYFKATPAINAAMWSQVRTALSQPNGRADRPWPEGGDFDGGDGFEYLALGPHHTEGEFWAPLIEQALASGVVEITEAEYIAAMPPIPT